MPSHESMNTLTSANEFAEKQPAEKYEGFQLTIERDIYIYTYIQVQRRQLSDRTCRSDTYSLKFSFFFSRDKRRIMRQVKLHNDEKKPPLLLRFSFLLDGSTSGGNHATKNDHKTSALLKERDVTFESQTLYLDYN